MIESIAIATQLSEESVLGACGPGWAIDLKKSSRCQYAVFFRRKAYGLPHSAFLLGTITSLQPIRQADRKRFVISIGEFARIDRPGIWALWRNPIRYTTLEALDIDPQTLEFTATSLATRPQEDWAANASARSPGKLTISEAKLGLSEMFGVDLKNIQITINA